MNKQGWQVGIWRPTLSVSPTAYPELWFPEPTSGFNVRDPWYVAMNNSKLKLLRFKLSAKSSQCIAACHSGTLAIISHSGVLKRTRTPDTSETRTKCQIIYFIDIVTPLAASNAFT
ncbi:hypothetical protein CBL_02031 [Carabus blaptoides fortunei]